MGPSRWWYAVAAAIAVVGTAAGAVLITVGIVGYFDRLDELQRVPVGGTGDVVFEDDGGFTVYLEERSRFVREVFPEDVEPNFACDGGFEPDLDEYSSDVTYDDGGVSGTAVFSFGIPEPMRCELSPTLAGEPRRGARLAVGRSLSRGIVPRALFGSALIVGSWLAAGVLGLVVVLRRQSARRSFPPPQHTPLG